MKLVTTEGTERTEDRLTGEVIGAAIEVHRVLGPGLLESAYEKALLCELKERGLMVEEQKPLPVRYKSVEIDCAYRIDLLVEQNLIIELKSADHLLPIHEAQLLTYMKLADISKGLLLNFNVRRLKDGIKRMVL